MKGIQRPVRTAALRLAVAAVVVGLTVIAPATGARGQDVVLPLAAGERQQIETYLGPGVLGAALPSERIADASAYFPLQERQFVFQVTSGRNAGTTQALGLKKTRRPIGTPAWRFQFATTLAAINPTAGGDLVMPAVSDSDEGVVAVSTPANPFVLAGIEPGESRTFAQTVSVNYLDDPTRRDWGGYLNATYTYVGTYQVTVPAGTYPAVLLRFAYQGKVGPADVSYTAWYFFARDIGLVAMVTMEDVSAFWIYHVDTTAGKVRAVK